MFTREYKYVRVRVYVYNTHLLQKPVHRNPLSRCSLLPNAADCEKQYCYINLLQTDTIQMFIQTSLKRDNVSKDNSQSDS